MYDAVRFRENDSGATTRHAILRHLRSKGRDPRALPEHKRMPP